MTCSKVPPRVSILLRQIDCRALRNACERVSHDFWDLPPEKLEVLAKPTRADRGIYFNLWTLLASSLDSAFQIKGAQLYKNVCSYTYFWANILRSPAKVVWLMAPVDAFHIQLDHIFRLSLSRVTETISKPPVRADGSFDHRLGNLQFSTFKLLAEHPLLLPEISVAGGRNKTRY